MKILVTGGAGFIGSHLVDALLAAGRPVRVFDNLDPQVHRGRRPDYLNPEAEFVSGDVRDRAAFTAALAGCEAVFHLAAAVGVGQSQYQVRHYTDVNIGGTAVLFDILANEKNRVGKVVTAGSMSSYGEGLYRCRQCGPVKPPLRPDPQLAAGAWEPCCPGCAGSLAPLPTPETTPQDANSVYALTKKVQEEMTLLYGRTWRLPVAVTRFFNVYGTRQSLSNPYTGVAAIFLSRLKNDRAPVVYEDGGQTRDFVAVSDVCRALIAALDSPAADGRVFNIGSGVPLAISEVAAMLARALDRRIAPEITGSFRRGDVRHCYADIGAAAAHLGWRPAVTFAQGLAGLIAWAGRVEAEDRFPQAEAEMKERGLC